MPVPTKELKLQIVNAATGKTLGAKAAPGADGALVVRDFPDGGPSPQQWQLTPVQAAQGGQAQDDQVYVICDAAGGKVLDNPAAADRGVRQFDASAGKKGQQWRVVPVEGEAGLYIIEGVTDGAVLDLADLGKDPGEEETRVVLGEYDESAESQRWRLVPAEPERTSDPVLRYAPLSHWNGRRSWRLTRSTALRPTPAATPSFSDMLLVLKQFGSDQGAGEWKSIGADRSRGGQPGWWVGLGDRFLADTTGAGRADIVGLKPAVGAVRASSRGDGTFEDDEHLLHPPAPSASPKDLWTLADTTGDGKPDAVVLCADGVRVSPQGEDGTFAPATGEPALKAFGHGQQTGGWLADKHPRFLADTTGSSRLDVVGFHDDGLWISLQDEDGKFAPLAGEPALSSFGYGEDAGGWLADEHPRFLADTTGSSRLDVVGFHDDGVWVSLQDEDGTFAEPLYVLDDFGTDQGWTSVEEHPRFLVSTTGGAAVDIVGFGPQGVVVARGRKDGTFEPAELVLNDFGSAQGWTSKKHLRFLADVIGDGNPDIVGFGDEGVWVSRSRDGRFEQAQLVCRGFGYNDDAGAWRVEDHPRFLADITGDGRVDIVGFGGPGVCVARNLFRHFRTR
ncbi:MAG TPA: RICIN domain-containing protein [Streptomyces sp.]|uniref:RICIN domain-containing protein n=1 Tax=Streptomyces sp. TaxID=1931 RepID=UPI002C7D91B9|nr:RICIN domain-containing protein [Streptomyces sp.]HWU08975.1 RICIN domain-containing protein [Streptomyces sp.]